MGRKILKLDTDLQPIWFSGERIYEIAELDMRKILPKFRGYLL